MPTKIEISLSAEQYHKGLETVIAETRQAASRMSALRCGFTSGTYFIKVFRRHCGATPGRAGKKG